MRTPVRDSDGTVYAGYAARVLAWLLFLRPVTKNARQASAFRPGKDSADAEQRRVAIAICRTARINPLAADADRS